MCPSRTDAGIRTACPSGETANNPRPAANLPIQTLKRAAAADMSPARRGKCMVRQGFIAPGLHYGRRFVQPQRLEPVQHPGGFAADSPFALPGVDDREAYQRCVLRRGAIKIATGFRRPRALLPRPLDSVVTRLKPTKGCIRSG